MAQVKEIPYGISDFNRIRNNIFYFVDKTMYLPLIEKCRITSSLSVPVGSGRVFS